MSAGAKGALAEFGTSVGVGIFRRHKDLTTWASPGLTYAH